MTTMAPSPDRNPKEVGNSNDIMMEDDEVTVVTETPTTKTDFIEAEMMDLNIRYEINHGKGHSPDEDHKRHIEFLIVITKAFDKSTLRIYDNKNKRVKSFAEAKWLDKEYYEDHFNTHSKESQRKTLVVHRIMTMKPIAAIKNEPTVMKHLKKTNTFLRGHFWKEDEVLLKDIGFLVSYLPTKHSKEFVSQDMFKRCNLTPDVEWSQAPAFKIIHAQPRIKLSEKQQPIKTHAFSVQVQAKMPQK
jgi:hypothetical protein